MPDWPALRLPRSLFVRIAVLYLVLLLLLCGICVWLTVINGNRFVAEMEQRFNLMTAANIGRDLAQPLRRDPTGAALRRAARRIVALNPTLDLYLLDERGRILAAFGCEHPAVDRVATGPIRGLLHARQTLPIRGVDPCRPGVQRVFSAATADLGAAGNGYLYAVLTSPLQTSAASRARGSYLLRTTALILVFALGFTGVLGLILFAWLTRRFRHLTAAVRRFQAGDHSGRAQARSSDEIGDLSRAFNAMAATIEAQVQALRRTDEARRELVANLSHDFRTPLTSLRAYIERMLTHARELSASEHERYLRAALGNAGDLEKLAAALSDLSRLEAHTVPLRAEAFSLAELVQDMLVKFGPRAEAVGVGLTAGALRELPPVEADIGLVERVLSNLVDNAIGACRDGGRVCIDAATRDGRLQITVADDGIGIAQAELPQVTRRFYRTAGSRSRGAAGSGLGLAIAREIVALHGGRMHVDSRVDAGTAIVFDLPLAAAGERPTGGRAR